MAQELAVPFSSSLHRAMAEDLEVRAMVADLLGSVCVANGYEAWSMVDDITGQEFQRGEVVPVVYTPEDLIV